MGGVNLTLNGTHVPSANTNRSYYNYTINPENYFPGQVLNDNHQHLNHTTSNGAETAHDIAYLILFGLTSLVGLVGNLMVCKVVFSKGVRRNFTNLLLANLAISDVICVLIFFIDLLVCSNFVMINVGDGACIAAKIVQTLSFQVSSVTMTIIAIDRFLLVYCPLVHKHRRIPLHYLMPFVWIVSFIVIFITSPRHAMFWFFTPEDGNGGLIKCEVREMFPEHPLKPTDFSVKIMLANTGLFWLPLSIIVVCYSCITWKVAERNVGTMTPSQQELLLRQKWKTIKMLIASVAVFFICWAPLMFLNLLESLGLLTSTREELCDKKSVLGGISFWLVYSSSCCNPFVYWIYSDEFRRGLSDVWTAVGKYIHCCVPGYCYCCCGVTSSETELSSVSRANSQSTNIISLSMRCSSLDCDHGQS